MRRGCRDGALAERADRAVGEEKIVSTKTKKQIRKRSAERPLLFSDLANANQPLKVRTGRDLQYLSVIISLALRVFDADLVSASVKKLSRPLQNELYSIFGKMLWDEFTKN